MFNIGAKPNILKPLNDYLPTCNTYYVWTLGCYLWMISGLCSNIRVPKICLVQRYKTPKFVLLHKRLPVLYQRQKSSRVYLESERKKILYVLKKFTVLILQANIITPNNPSYVQRGKETSGIYIGARGPM